MGSSLRRLPGRYIGPHPYQVSGSLDGLTPGRRAIERLIVKRLGPDARDGLAPLAGFKDLRRLELEWPEAVDLSPLAGLELECLRIDYGQRLDLGPLAEVSLKHLDVVSPRDCTVPSKWPLAPSLESFGLMVERLFGSLLRDAVAAIPWAALGSLRGLALGGRGNFVDLGLLAELPRLEVLDVRGCATPVRARRRSRRRFPGCPSTSPAGSARSTTRKPCGPRGRSIAGPPAARANR
jgi:hypothetical protein